MNPSIASYGLQTYLHHTNHESHNWAKRATYNHQNIYRQNQYNESQDRQVNPAQDRQYPYSQDYIKIVRCRILVIMYSLVSNNLEVEDNTIL